MHDFDESFFFLFGTRPIFLAIDPITSYVHRTRIITLLDRPMHPINPSSTFLHPLPDANLELSLSRRFPDIKHDRIDETEQGPGIGKCQPE